VRRIGKCEHERKGEKKEKRGRRRRIPVVRKSSVASLVVQKIKEAEG
jgi:hypothetical protein